MRPEFSAVPFADRAQAEDNLARLEQRLAPGLSPPLASLLTHSPDPDGVLQLLECFAKGAPPEVLEDLAHFPSALTYLVAIFGYCDSLGELLLAEHSLAIQFARDRHFTRLKSSEDLLQDYARYSVTSPDLWLSSQLARFKRRNHLRIGLKDVLRLSTLGETMLELSTLADVILKQALAFCDQELEKRYGQPQYRDAQGRIVRSGFSIVSFGKLGGAELDYNSDIDLLFLYTRDGETAGGNEHSSIITNKEYFVRLAEAINRTITQETPHGGVFRVDVSQRPEGEHGDSAISLSSILEYYDHRAREWELQMLIKARHSAGDSRLTRDFLCGVEPYLYRLPVNSEAVQSEFEQRDKYSMSKENSGDDALDVRFHAGGIRDIEFLVQRLQRMHGGRDPWVRAGGTLFALRKLNDKGIVPDADFALLTAAYELFRKVEHRIQLKAGQPSNRWPSRRDDLDRLAHRTGLEAGTSVDAGLKLVTQLKYTFARVNEICQRLVHSRTAESG